MLIKIEGIRFVASPTTGDFAIALLSAVPRFATYAKTPLDMLFAFATAAVGR